MYTLKLESKFGGFFMSFPDVGRGVQGKKSSVPGFEPGRNHS